MKRWGPLVLLGAATGFTIALLPYAQRLAAFLPPCPFRAVTGIPCPTCGTTRALVALSRGQLAQALVNNPMFTLGLVLAGLAALVWTLNHGRGMRITQALAPLQYRWPWWLRVGVALALVANWAWVLARS